MAARSSALRGPCTAMMPWVRCWSSIEMPSGASPRSVATTVAALAALGIT